MAADNAQSAADASAQEAVAKAFDLLARGVQRQLWRMGWTELRPIQVDAIRTIMLTGADMVIASETASGKTEAAFLPILSKIADEPIGSVRAMYVGPLRALINDQFQRLEQLCQYLDVPTHRWHGDVGVSAKSKLLKEPGGVLLITPESLESLFVNRSHYLTALFCGLRHVVIDELHSFLDNERGLHLQSLLCRLRRVTTAAGTSFGMVGLSATIGDFTAARKYVNRARPQSVKVIQDESGGKELKYRLHAYVASTPTDDGGQGDPHAPEAELAVMHQISEDIVEHCRGTGNLIFANAKGDIEVYADLCNETARRERLPESFLVHHGSLSREIREDTESAMKSSPAMTAICSSTLEMGIDIGSVRMVGQIGAPWSVGSLKQRLGRSGRKEGEPRILRLYIPCREPDANASVLDRLHLDLIQAVAASQLLLEGWVEPPAPARCDLSTLTQQAISVIAETGGTSAAELYDRLVQRGAFAGIEVDLFSGLVRALGQNDIVEQMEGGDLILGLEGERIRSARDFYAAFQTPAEFSVTTGERLIGTLPILVMPAVGDHILLGGRRWKIIAVDVDRSEILVQAAHGRKRPLFSGEPGVIQARIRQRMRDVLSSDADYVYLTGMARGLLRHARQVATEAGILTDPLLTVSSERTLWFTWTGTNTQITLMAIIDAAGFSTHDRGIAIEVDLPKAKASGLIQKLAAARLDPQRIAAGARPKLRRKYDYLLTDELLDMVLLRDVLDVDGAQALCREYLERTGGSDICPE